MKKILTAIATAVFIIYPSICFASYVIHLKDGREFVTNRYWEEGDQIKFKRYGGVIGIHKDLVRGIKEIKDFPEDEGKKDKTRANGEKEAPGKRAEPKAKPKEVEKVKLGGQSEKTAPHSEEREVGPEEEQSEIDESEKKPDDEQLDKNKRIALSLKVKEALESYARAKKVGDRHRIAEEFRRVSQISSELEDLEKEVKAKNGGILPSWWWEEPEPAKPG